MSQLQRQSTAPEYADRETFLSSVDAAMQLALSRLDQEISAEEALVRRERAELAGEQREPLRQRLEAFPADASPIPHRPSTTPTAAPTSIRLAKGSRANDRPNTPNGLMKWYQTVLHSAQARQQQAKHAAPTAMNASTATASTWREAVEASALQQHMEPWQSQSFTLSALNASAASSATAASPWQKQQTSSRNGIQPPPSQQRRQQRPRHRSSGRVDPSPPRAPAPEPQPISVHSFDSMASAATPVEGTNSFDGSGEHSQSSEASVVLQETFDISGFLEANAAPGKHHSEAPAALAIRAPLQRGGRKRQPGSGKKDSNQKPTKAQQPQQPHQHPRGGRGNALGRQRSPKEEEEEAVLQENLTLAELLQETEDSGVPKRRLALLTQQPKAAQTRDFVAPPSPPPSPAGSGRFTPRRRPSPRSPSTASAHSLSPHSPAAPASPSPSPAAAAAMRGQAAASPQPQEGSLAATPASSASLRLEAAEDRPGFWKDSGTSEERDSDEEAATAPQQQRPQEQPGAVRNNAGGSARAAPPLLRQLSPPSNKTAAATAAAAAQPNTGSPLPLEQQRSAEASSNELPPPEDAPPQASAAMKIKKRRKLFCCGSKKEAFAASAV